MKLTKIKKNKQDNNWYNLQFEDEQGNKYVIVVYEAYGIKDLYMSFN